MRKTWIFILIILTLVLCGTACQKQQTSSVYKVLKNETTYTVDPEQGTISDGTYIYYFSVQANPNQTRMEITYPDGSSYWWVSDEHGGYGGFSDDYDPERFADGFILTDVLESGQPRRSSSSGAGWSILLIPLGLWNLIWPYSSWYLSHGWRYKNAEPSEAALALNRIGGAVLLAAGLILLLA